MRITKLPTDVNHPWYTFSLALDAVTYIFEMAYNNRADRWHLSLLNAAGAPIVRGIPLLIDRDLLASYRHLGVPQGLLTCVDTTGKQAQPGLGSFLIAHGLYYLGDSA